MVQKELLDFIKTKNPNMKLATANICANNNYFENCQSWSVEDKNN
jgi:hypothetical protein